MSGAGDGEGEMTEGEAREVLGWGFDPRAFDVEEANERLDLYLRD